MTAFKPQKLLTLADHLETQGVSFDAQADEHEKAGEKEDAEKLRKRAHGRRYYAEVCREAVRLILEPTGAPQRRLAAKVKRAGFVPPTLKEVEDFGLIYPLWPRADIAAWWNHFQSVGWRVNTKPMVDWKAAAANGYRRWLKDNPQKGAATGATDPAGWREFLAEKERPYKSFALESGWVRTEFEQKGRA